MPHGVSENVTASDATADDAKFSRMSKQEQQRLRDQSIAGLQNVLQSLDNRSEVGSAVGSQVSNPNTLSGRHVLNLENSLVSQPTMLPMPFMSHVPGAHMHAMPQMPMAYPKAVWPPHVSHQFPQPGQSSGAQSSSGATGFVPFDPNAGSFPWWEVSEKPDDEIRTRRVHITFELADVMAVLVCLVDPGAHDNLIGGLTAQQMCSELQSKLHLRAMNKPLPVEGVGKAAQVADKLHASRCQLLMFLENRQMQLTRHRSSRIACCLLCLETGPFEDAGDHGLRHR